MKDLKQSFELKPIGYIRSCFTQKFTIPRQSGLVKHAKATLHLLPEFSHPDIVRGLTQYSHLWLIFIFHESPPKKNRNTVRPPRLGGNEKLGVFATRSNFRPNPIGQSAVMLDKIDIKKSEIIIHLSGVDILDGTPVLDIKPYVPYSDAIPLAQAGMASEPPKQVFKVEFSDLAKTQLVEAKRKHGDDFQRLIEETLSYDVRPAYYGSNSVKRYFHSQIHDYGLQWKVVNEQVFVLEVSKLD